MAREREVLKAFQRLKLGFVSKNARQIGQALRERIDEAAVEVLDQVVSKLAGHPIRTRTSAPPPARTSEPPTRVVVRADESERPSEPEWNDTGEFLAATRAPEPEPAPEAEAPLSVEAQVPVETIEVPEPADDDVAPTQIFPPWKEIELATSLLPERHGIDRLIVLPRGPRRVFVYWEIDPARIAAQNFVDAHGELWLFDVDGKTFVQRSIVAPEQGRAYLQLPDENVHYALELRLISQDLHSATLSVSKEFFGAEDDDFSIALEELRAPSQKDAEKSDQN